MRVIGIDPGYDRMGIAILDGDRNAQHVLHSECFTPSKQKQRLERFFDAIQRVETLMQQFSPDACALETVYFSNNQKTAFAIAEVRGALLYVARQQGCRVAEYAPNQVKQAITGYGKSDKQNMAFMLSQVLKLPQGKRLDDEYDALGIALTHLVISTSSTLKLK